MSTTTSSLFLLFCLSVSCKAAEQSGWKLLTKGPEGISIFKKGDAGSGIPLVENFSCTLLDQKPAETIIETLHGVSGPDLYMQNGFCRDVIPLAVKQTTFLLGKDHEEIKSRLAEEQVRVRTYKKLLVAWRKKPANFIQTYAAIKFIENENTTSPLNPFKVVLLHELLSLKTAKADGKPFPETPFLNELRVRGYYPGFFGEYSNK